MPEDRGSPQVLDHTFCTNLANSGAAIDVIREFAGHADRPAALAQPMGGVASACSPGGLRVRLRGR